MLTPSLCQSKQKQTSDTIRGFYQNPTGTRCVTEHAERIKWIKRITHAKNRKRGAAVVRSARMERCPSLGSDVFLYSLLRPALPFHQIFPATLQKIKRSRFRRAIGLSERARIALTDTCFCVTDAVAAVWVGERNAANTRLIRRLMMDSAAKTLSPTADSSMIHHANTPIFSRCYYFSLPSFRSLRGCLIPHIP